MSSDHLSFITPDYSAVKFDDIKSSNDGDVCIAYITNELIKDTVDPICIDVGADIAAWTLLCKHINPRSILYTFEPNPISFEAIKKYESNTIILFNKGVSDISGSFYMEFNGSNSSMRTNTGSLIETTRLDFIFDIHNIVNLIKIDTEGHDIVILNSLDAYYSRINSIIFEFTVYWYGKTDRECLITSLGILMKLYKSYKYMYIVSRNHKPRVVRLDDTDIFMTVIKFLYINHLQVDIIVTNFEIKNITICNVDEMIMNANSVLF